LAKSKNTSKSTAPDFTVNKGQKMAGIEMKKALSKSDPYLGRRPLIMSRVN